MRNIKKMEKQMLLGLLSALLCLPVSAQMSFRQIGAEEDTLNVRFVEITNRAFPVENECVVELGLKFQVPKNARRKLAYYIKERERRKICYNYIYGDSILKRVRCKMELDSIYRDSINTLLIPVEGNKLSGDNVSLALRLRKLLKLDDAQYQFLMENALVLARRIYMDPRTNVWNEDVDALRKGLSPQQLSNFFMTKNAKSATEELDRGWQRLVDAGLSEELDSVKEFPSAYAFFQERLRIKDMYRYHGTSQKKYLAELYKHKPAMVRMLEALDKMENERKKKKQKENNSNINKDFVW